LLVPVAVVGVIAVAITLGGTPIGSDPVVIGLPVRAISLFLVLLRGGLG
jgi:hypothetical protein